MDNEFNDEQQVMIAILAAVGVPNPETVVRGARMDATVMGSSFIPVLQDLADGLAKAVDAIANLPQK